MAMTKLWQLLTSELGSAFRNQYGNAGGSEFNHWAKELSEFTESQLVNGLENFKNSGKTYMSLNIFRNHCKPDAEALGLPNFEAAFRALIMAEWQNMPEAFRVLFAQHRYDLRQRSDAEARKLFRPIYEDAIKRISQGEEIKLAERIKLENPSGTTHTNRFKGPTGNEAMKSIKKMMGMR